MIAEPHSRWIVARLRADAGESAERKVERAGTRIVDRAESRELLIEGTPLATLRRRLPDALITPEREL